MMKRIMVGVCYACNCKVVKSGPFCPGTYISYSLESKGNCSQHGSVCASGVEIS